MRSDDRKPSDLRPLRIEINYVPSALGSVLISTGRTRVLCTASVEPSAPPWLKRGGWVTAEYAMLPGATQPRGKRDPGGRGKEIQRLIGRSLRSAVDLSRLVGPQGPISIICDCDVIEADGGTRTASITGAYVALRLALRRLVEDGRFAEMPIVGAVAAVSVGLQAKADGSRVPLLDLCYEEDSSAVVDLNVVARKERDGIGLVEVQGTGETGTFSRSELNAMLDLAERGISELMAAQADAQS